MSNPGVKAIAKPRVSSDLLDLLVPLRVVYFPCSLRDIGTEVARNFAPAFLRHLSHTFCRRGRSNADRMSGCRDLRAGEV